MLEGVSFLTDIRQHRFGLVERSGAAYKRVPLASRHMSSHRSGSTADQTSIGCCLCTFYLVSDTVTESGRIRKKLTTPRDVSRLTTQAGPIRLTARRRPVTSDGSAGRTAVEHVCPDTVIAADLGTLRHPSYTLAEFLAGTLGALPEMSSVSFPLQSSSPGPFCPFLATSCPFVSAAVWRFGLARS